MTSIRLKMLIKSFSHALKPTDVYVTVTSPTDTSTFLDTTHYLVVSIEYLWDLILYFPFFIFKRWSVVLYLLHIDSLGVRRIISQSCKHIDAI